jgi:D-3-phosphoglycerate dehydrogenase / 2-oxoglutarate reductase
LAPPGLSLEIEERLLGPAGLRLVRVGEPAAGDAEVLIVFAGRVDAGVLASVPRCRGVVCFSTGMDNVDLAAAAAIGMPVRNVPDYATEEVAEHALALLLACARKIVPLHAGGSWNWRPVMGEVHTLAASTLGVVGLGRIGRRLVSRAKGIGLRTLAHDPYVPAESIPLADLLATSDFVSLHAPLMAETRHLINASTLSQMKPSAFLINTARGGLVDEAALVRALQDGVIAGAALDVREHEPPEQPDPLAGLPNVILTPHVGAYSVEAVERLHQYGCRQVLEVLGVGEAVV